jgi:hypothetical protein
VFDRLLVDVAILIYFLGSKLCYHNIKVVVVAGNVHNASTEHKFGFSGPY